MSKIRSNKCKIVRSTFPRIREIQRPYGTTWVLDCRRKGWTGKRLMEFRDKKECLIKAKEVQELFYRPYGPQIVSQFEVWNKELQPFGKSVEDVVKDFLQEVNNIKNINQSPKVPELVQKWVDFKFNDPNKTLRPDSLRHIRSFGVLISEDLSKDRIKHINRKKIIDLMERKTKDGWSKIYRKNYLRYLRGFLRWCMDHEQLIDSDPSRGIQVTLDTSEVDVLNIDEVHQLCQTMLNPEHEKIRGYMVLGLFGGIRSKEVSKLTWNDVSFDHDHIVISPTVSKTKKGRLVPISPVLKSWLKILDQDEPLVPKTTKPLLKVLREQCPSVFRQNVRRHTFATYHLSHHQNCSQLSEILGNSEPIIRRHYVRMMNKRDSERFWKMTPQSIVPQE